jgi:hypothetical protein
MVPDYKPSDVDLLTSGFPPLLATFDKTEAECMGALICRALAVLGDEWRPIGWTEIVGVAKADIGAAAFTSTGVYTLPDLIRDICRNPLANPNPHDLVGRGFAEWTDAPGGLLAFTERGFDRLRKWVRKPVAETKKGG